MSDIVPMQEKEREERREGGWLHLFLFLHSATCECRNCILMRNNEKRMRRSGPGLEPFTVHVIYTLKLEHQLSWCACVLPANRRQITMVKCTPVTPGGNV